jgi:23S rRNA pseudouridine1911/1915/1917 synthase
MSSETISHRAVPGDSGRRLDELLLELLSARLGREAPSKSKVRRLVMAGAVAINGRPLRHASLRLASGMDISIRLDRELFLAEMDPGDIVFEMAPRDIVFEDEWIIAVNKPAGLPTEPTIVANRDHLQAAVVRFLAKRNGGGDPPLYIHHRLDRDTSGVIVFSKRKEANAGLHAIFERHLAQKTYLAICRRPACLPSAEFRVENRLGRISPKSQAAKWGAVSQGGAPAQTDFSLRRTGASGLLVEARPITGRTHQIRVHLAGLGLPLWGDPLYGGPGRIAGQPVGRVMLHALKLELPHPVDGRPLAIEAPLPADFRACLELMDHPTETGPHKSRQSNSDQHSGPCTMRPGSGQPRKRGCSHRRPH